MRFNRQFSLFCVVALSVAMISSTAEAQRGGRGGGGPQGGGQRGGGGFGGQQGGGQRGGFTFGGRGGAPTIGRSQLLRSEDVQKELKVSDAQMDTIKEAMEAFRKDREGSRPDRDAIQKMSREEQTALFQKMREDAEKATKEADTVLVALLEPAQIKRLDQIAFQVKSQAGIAALVQSEEIRKELSLTDEQVVKVTAIQEKSEEASRAAMEAMRNRGGDNEGERPDFRAMMEEMQKKREESRKANDAAVMAVLTDGQKAKIEELKGDAFEVDMRSLMGRGGRGGRGGDAGGRGGRGGEDGGRGGRGGDAGGRGGRGGEDGGRGGRGGRPASDDPDLT